MRIAIGSAFRNCGDIVLPYLDRVVGICKRMRNDTIRVIAAEGDSVDDTKTLLKRGAFGRGLWLEHIDVTHGLRQFGSTEEPERMVALSKIGNAIFNAVRPEDDVLVYVESDLHWYPEVIVELVHDALQRTCGFDVFSPLVMAGEAFYDIWGFRKDGKRFSPFAPHFPGLLESEYFAVDSVGSCLVMRAEVARACRIRNDYCLVGWCEDARAQGFRIAVRPSLQVRQA